MEEHKDACSVDLLPTQSQTQARQDGNSSDVAFIEQVDMDNWVSATGKF